MGVTLKDVAKAVGVTPSAVSQVLRGVENPKWIGEATKKRIWEAAQSLGYRPNPAARLLASDKGHYFAIVLSRLSDPTLREAVEEVLDRILAAGYIPFIVEARHMPLGLYDNLESLADAVLFFGTGRKEFNERIKQLTSGIATVVSITPQGSPFPEFIWNEEKGFDLILDHLDELGHRQVALLGGGMADGNRQRVVSFRTACQRRDWDEHIVFVDHEKDAIQAGRQMADVVLKKHPQVTAVVGRNVEFSVGALAEFQQQQLRVPEDMSIVSYADSRLATAVYPRLTALQTPVREAARQAVEKMLHMLKKQEVECEPIELELKFIPRDSTAFPRSITQP